MKQPQNETAEQRAERLRIAQAQMRIAYRQVFGSETGKLVLEDLKQRFGWKGNIERPSAFMGARPEDVFLTEGLKEPVRHILAMIEQEASDEPKLETKATHD